MKKIVLKFGLISGVIAATLMWLMMTMMKTGVADIDYGEIGVIRR